jgi:hypothetical protein
MSGCRQWWGLLACGLLAACAATRSIEDTVEGCESASEEASFEQLCANPGSLVVLCDEHQCGAHRCHEVLERLTVGRVVLARQGRPVLPNPGQRSTLTEPAPLPSPGPGVERYRGSTQGSSGHSQPVFIIPWSPKPEPELLPSQKQLLAEAEAYHNKSHEGHHIYPRAFRPSLTKVTTSTRGPSDGGSSIKASTSTSTSYRWRWRSTGAFTEVPMVAPGMRHGASSSERILTRARRRYTGTRDSSSTNFACSVPFLPPSSGRCTHRPFRVLEAPCDSMN